MKTIHYNQATYLTSAVMLSQLPSDQGAEVAFMGRSNAGKSSAINAITTVGGLARASRTPGRTQMINFFEIDASRRLVDLPGYGFARAQPKIKARWQQLITDYLETRESLVGLVMVMDSRHPLKPMDQTLIDWCVDFEVPLHILLTKADKITNNIQKKTLFSVQHSVSQQQNISVQLFSALKKTGVDAARDKLNEWFG